jgi:hypothetical protein
VGGADNGRDGDPRLPAILDIAPVLTAMLLINGLLLAVAVFIAIELRAAQPDDALGLVSSRKAKHTTV